MRRYNHQIKSNVSQMAFDICSKIVDSNTPPVFMCIGDSRFVSDCLGPLVGHLLAEKYNISAFVYGNLNNNITKQNADEYYKFIRKNHCNSKIIVIDSAMSEFEHLGAVSFNNSGALIGALNGLPSLVGDYSILANVATTGINSLMFLRSQKLKNVLSIAEFIASSVNFSLKLTKKLKANKKVAAL